MDTIFSSSVTNLFLFYCEFNYALNTIKSFRVLRHIDDLIAFHDKLLILINDINLLCLKLNKSSDDCFHLNFLGLDLITRDNNIQIKLFYK